LASKTYYHYQLGTGKDFSIKKACQVGVAVENGIVKYIMPVSTGQTGYATRENSFAATKYLSGSGDEARLGGWHDSSHFPSESGNGNMYLPIYFSGGQAIHGSSSMGETSFLTSAASKGCVRTRISDQRKLVQWVVGTIDYKYRARPALVVHVSP
jgi:hypothetical protein